MIAYSDALAVVRAAGVARPPAVETLPLQDAVGRVSAADVTSGEENPRFDNSGMDGFAVRAADLAGAGPGTPVTLPVGATVLAGDDPSRAPPEGAIEIMTGAALPPGRDAVVRVEDVEVRRDGSGNAVAATFRRPAQRGENVRPRGEDFTVGQRLLEAGATLRPQHVMALATVGEVVVAVRRRPRVAVIATGKEVVPHTERDLASGTIRNSTTPYLAAALPLYGAECVAVESVGDDVGAFRAAMGRAAAAADVVLTTGAVSAGKHDFVAAELAALDARVHFHKIAMRPGKPILFAELPRGPAVFGLPGNPIASAVGLRFLVAPFLRAGVGAAPEVPIRARLDGDVKKPAGLRWFVKAVLEVGPDGARVQVLPGQGSAMVRAMLAANAWAILPEEGDRSPRGAEVDVAPLFPAAESGPGRGPGSAPT